MSSSSPIRELQKRALRAARVAVRKAIQEKVRAGLPVYVSRNGKVVNLNNKARESRRKSHPAA